MFAGALAFSNAHFGQGSGPIFMDSVACGSSDTVLLACSYDPNTSEDSHAEDAGVRCGGECFSTFHTCTLGNVLCLITFCWEQHPALMEMFVWWVVVHHMKEEWRCVLMEHGEQCVMIRGVLQMLKWFADSWDSP